MGRPGANSTSRARDPNRLPPLPPANFARPTSRPRQRPRKRHEWWWPLRPAAGLLHPDARYSRQEIIAERVVPLELLDQHLERIQRRLQQRGCHHPICTSQDADRGQHVRIDNRSGDVVKDHRLELSVPARQALHALFAPRVSDGRMDG
eukprot:scaffold30033_cov101-Isochrysis_galbana.AAC.3